MEIQSLKNNSPFLVWGEGQFFMLLQVILPLGTVILVLLIYCAHRIGLWRKFLGGWG